MSPYMITAGEAYRQECESKRAYNRARSDARTAENFYKRARAHFRTAAWLTSRPDLWHDEGFDSPAEYEDAARTWVHLADHFLHSSFWQTDRARECAARARRYRQRSAPRPCSYHLNYPSAGTGHPSCTCTDAAS